MTAFLDAVLKGRDTVSDAADRRIAELEQRVKELGWENDNLRKSREVLGKQSAELHDRDLRHIESLRKQLVERDVYEAQQILPPEQAALIKHLATVERCIDAAEDCGDGDYDGGVCLLCTGGRDVGHEKTCAWLALQFDRKPIETMAMVEGWAWEENARRDRESEIALRLKMDEINGTGLYPKPDLGIPDTAVAPPDDEDVP